MIFVSVGTHEQQFNRLLKKIDELVARGTIKEKVFAQTGYSTYAPKQYGAEKFLSMAEFDKKVKNCSIFITHAGEGNIGTALQYEKKMIVVPRRKKYGEHTNDHQLELANAIKKEQQAVVCGVEDIADALKKTKKLRLRKTAHAKRIIYLIENYLKTV